MTTTVAKKHRLESIDWLRGFVMVLMALDHVRDFFSASGANPMEDPDISASLFATRWITHLCAPTFVLLAGVSAGLMAQRKTSGELSRFLLSRGLWLIFLEVTVIAFAWTFNFSSSPLIVLLVIWAIGVAMIVLAGLVYLPRSVVLGIGIAIVAGSNLLDGFLPLGGIDSPHPFWLSIHRSILWEISGIYGITLYPILAWSGLMACGYGLAGVFSWESEHRQRFLVKLGGGLLLLFVFLRWTNIYGDPIPWHSGDDWGQSLRSFLNVNKYPPSLLFLAATIGIALPLLAGVERWRSPPLHGTLVTIGRVPLFYYIIHIYFAHLLAVIAAVLVGFPASALFVPPEETPEGYGFGLLVVYAVWIGLVVALYPACRWFAQVKATRKDWWHSYL